MNLGSPGGTDRAVVIIDHIEELVWIIGHGDQLWERDWR